MANILIVEDEKDIAELISSQLKTQEHNCQIILDGAEALDLIQGENSPKFDLFILDRMLPGANGIEICKFLRMYKKTKLTPVLMLTAMTRPEQIVEGLEAGADDYMTKPFDSLILTARVKSLLRRFEYLNKKETESSEKEILELKNLKIDTKQCKVWASGKEIDLTLSEYKLMVTFMLSPGKVLTRNHLVESIQDGPVHVTDRTIDTHVFGLRKKLGDDAQMIETIRGIGYRVSNTD